MAELPVPLSAPGDLQGHVAGRDGGLARFPYLDISYIDVSSTIVIL